MLCLHASLTAARAVQLKAQLDSGMKALERGQRAADADALQAAVDAAAATESTAALLAEPVKAAAKQLAQWRNLTESEARLARVLKDGASTQQLARAIRDASTAGVSVSSAKRTLKVRAAAGHRVTRAAGGVSASRRAPYCANPHL